MPFREDLKIDVFLEQQNKIFSDTHTSDFVETPTVTNQNTPSKVGGGVVTVSSSKELETYPSLCWDVNGYYRELGVHWKATRRQLMEAYRDSGGPQSERLTYIFRQLLQPDIRKEYDLMPPGSVFLDEYVQQEIFRNAKQEAARRTQGGVLTSPERVLEDWGFSLATDEPDELDTSGDLWEDLPELEEEEGWPYSYYQLGTACQDTETMVYWQQLLIDGFADQGMVVRFAVGFTGKHENYHIGSFEGLTIFYLDDTIELEDNIAEMLIEAYRKDF